MTYLESETDFYRFLTFDEKLSKNVRTNYISWLRFLAARHFIDVNLTDEVIDNIIAAEALQKKERNIYTKDKDLSNFKSALRKYLKFTTKEYAVSLENKIRTEKNKIANNTTLGKTEKEALIAARLGHGKFRNKLIKYWQGCSITNLEKTGLLIASHIKPWANSDNLERLDPFNGLLLLPNYDKLFDSGYINFSSKGKIRISKFLTESDKNTLNLNESLKLRNLENEHLVYLDYHRENCFIN